MEERDDHSLLQAIALRRDQDAFAEFYSRFEKPAYSLACHLTGSTDLAEEAVQEAMTNVWRFASTFSQSGNARGWVLRIVANKCARLSQQRRKLRSRTVDAELIPLESESSSPGESAERTEVLVGLRKMLERLASDDRHLVALYFGAGLTCDEIAHDCSMPARTVSFRIQKAIETLRSHLVKAGLTAALPMLESARLGEALISGYPVPPGLKERVLQGVLEAGGGALKSVSMRATVVKSSAAVYAAVALLVAGAVAGLLYVASPGRLNSVADSPLAVQPERGTQHPPAAAGLQRPAEPFRATWDFEQGPAADLFSMSTAWTWTRLPAGGAMACPQGPINEWVGVVLPQRLPARDLVITLHLNSVTTAFREFGAEALWANETGLLPFQRWAPKKMQTLSSISNLLQIHLLGAYVVNVNNGAVNTIYQYAKPFPSDRICLLLANWSVHKIEIQENPDSAPVVSKPDPVAEIERLKAQDCKVELRPLRPLDWTSIPEKYR